MKRLILHVGTMKTGTTAIQGFLEANASLLEEQGIAYPLDFGSFDHGNPNRNGNFLRRAVLARVGATNPGKRTRELIGKALERFKGHVESSDAILLSEEVLWREGILYDGYWEELGKLVGECGIEQVDIVVYLRRQDGYAESRWRQWVKMFSSYTDTFDEYRANPQAMKPNDYKLGLDLLARAFGKEHLAVRVYDRGVFAAHDVVRDFLEAAGIRDDARFDFEDYKAKQSNDSLSEDYTELKRLVNHSPAYQRAGRNFYKAPAAMSMGALDGHEGKWHMSSEERAAFMEPYAQGNAAIAREYLGRADGVLFPEPEPGDPGWTCDAEMLLRESIVFYAEALARERTAREKAEKRIGDLEKRLESLESGKQGGGLRSRLFG